MNNLLCKCEACLKSYIDKLHKQIENLELELENKKIQIMKLSGETIFYPENTNIDIDTNKH